MKSFNEFVQAERSLPPTAGGQRSVKVGPETQGADSTESGHIPAAAVFHARISQSSQCLGKNWVLPLVPSLCFRV